MHRASVSANTCRAYAGALGQLDAWLGGQKLDDAALAAYLAELHAAGRAASSAGMAVAAARFRARLAGQVDPAGEQTARVLAGYRRLDLDDLLQHARHLVGIGLVRHAHEHRHAVRRVRERPVQVAQRWRDRPRAVRHHRSGLQGARRLVGAGLNRIHPHIEQREQARDRDGPSR